MITIKLELASNGVIKTVMDNNYNGAGSNHEVRSVYETDNDEEFHNTIRFLYDLMDDLGMDSGNKFSKNSLDITSVWGDKYNPSLEELNQVVKQTSEHLRDLKKWQKELKQQTIQDSIVETINSKKDDLPF
tara:strand:+ start:110 stop:502 length:393 start_codon:yes stop_codon:yes gene_type:complete